jgi:DnaJ-domain-containing protein 1
LYRDVAKRIHPDLAIDSTDRLERERLMTAANRAYEEGDEARLRAILEEYESSPDSIKGEGPGAELVRVIRKIAQVERRLVEIDKEVGELEKSERFHLKAKADKAATKGRDLLAEMAETLDSQIAASRERLENLSER